MATLLPPPTMPAVVLDAPVNATWAANHGQYWRERGIDGFLFHGLDIDLAEVEGIEQEGDDDNEPGLLREIRVAQQRLRSQGLGRNFFLTTLPGSPQDVKALETRFRALGHFTRRAGLQGLAIRLEDLPADWLPVPPGNSMTDGRAVADRRERLQGAASTALLAFIDAHPSGEILLLADTPLSQGRWWWAVFGGMLDASGKHDARLHLLDLGTRSLDSPAALLRYRDNFRWHARSLLGAAHGALWDDHGALGLALEPVLRSANGFEARHSTGSQRVLTAAAKVLSDGYVAVASPVGGLWEVSARDAAAYDDLLQAVPVTETGPLLPAVQQLSFHTPLDRLARIGPFTAPDGAPVHVFQDANGASVLFWGGLPAPTRLESRAQLVETWDIPRAEARSAIPRDGAVVLQPTNAPLLVHGLPVRTWSVPAGLAFEPDAPLRSGGGVRNLRIGWRNGAPVRIEAEISLWPPDTFGIRTATHQLGLDSGAARHWATELRGRGSAGTVYDFSLAMLQDGGGMITRTFRQECHVPKRWEAVLPGPVTHGPLALHGDDEGPWYACTSGGRYLTVLDGHGNVQWEWDTGDAELTALAGCGTSRGMLATQDKKGRIVFRDHRGNQTGRHTPSPEYAGAAMTWVPLHGGPVALLFGPASTLALDVNGNPLWERRWSGPAKLPAFPQEPTPLDEDLFAPVVPVLLREIGGYRLHGLDHDGETAWTISLAGSAPGLEAAMGRHNGRWQVVAAAPDGTWFRIDATSGERLAAARLPVSGPVRALLPATTPLDTHAFWLVHDNTAHLVDAEGQYLHPTDLPDDTYRLVGYLQDDSGALVSAQGNRIQSLAEPWRDHPFPGPLGTSPTVVTLETDDGDVAGMAAGGGPIMRLLEIPRAKQP